MGEEERLLLHLTRKELEDRCDLNQLIQDERRVMRMSWSMVSKAADICRLSSRQRQDIFMIQLR